jgi:hypothetical protein
MTSDDIGIIFTCCQLKCISHGLLDFFKFSIARYILNTEGLKCEVTYCEMALQQFLYQSDSKKIYLMQLVHRNLVAAYSSIFWFF